MTILSKPVEQIVEQDLLDLIAGKVLEKKRLDYKRDLPGSSDKCRKEFVFDISSFANSSGGLLIYGMDEKNGAANNLTGIQSSNIDADILRIESMIRDGIRPRIPGVNIHHIVLSDTGTNPTYAVLVRIPQSWAAPHMVTVKGASKFYARNSKGKYQLDVDEIRAAFSLSEAAPERIRAFRQERIARIEADETPVSITNKTKIILHLIPLSAFTTQERFEVGSLWDSQGQLYQLLMGGGSGWRYNLDGFLVSSDGDGYLQLYSNGVVEAVAGDMFKPWPDDRKVISAQKLLVRLKQGLFRYTRLLKQLQVPTPFLIMVSLTGLRGYYIPLPIDSPMLDNPFVDRDIVVIPDVMVENYEEKPEEVLRPIFDAIWNAAGYPRCSAYDQNGKFIGFDSGGF